MSVFSSFASRLVHHDWILTSSVFVLACLGLTAIYSVDLSRGDSLIYFPTQLLAITIGVLAVICVGSVHLTFYRSLSVWGYIGSLALLLAVLFFGVTVRGTTGWFRIAGFSFQPAECAKVGLILFLSWWISIYGRRFDRWQFVFTTGGFTLLLMACILMQPDLGSSLMLFFVWFGLLLFTGTKKRYIAFLVCSGLFLSVFAWFFVLKDYQKDRLSTFLQPNNPEYALTTRYNVNQSLIAIGAGQFWGRGLGFGSQSQLHFLPEAQTDFIFAVIAEELGFLGVLMLLGLYGLMLFRLVRLIGFCTNDFSAYLILGVVLLFFSQLVVNLGGAMSLLPVTGVTLPFVSYGGSSLVFNFILIGIVQSVAVSEYYGRRDSFVHGMIGE